MSEDTGRAEGKPPHLDRLSVLWRRLNDHKIVQWSVAYVALAYAIQHAIILTGESFEWPNAVARVSMLLLALGLPLVITFAWYHGAKASRNFSQAELSILAALLVMSSLLFYVFVRPADGDKPPQPEPARVANTISLAVLPFTNLSGDAAQEFFSDGMTEEITSALSKIPDLRVVGRTSAFQFKSQAQDLRAIGQSLSATHLIEGSVRKAGDRLRITVQLIKADDGTHVWSEDYDRQFTDVFAIQEDIAQTVAVSLRVPLGLRQGERLVANRASDLDSYQQYLRAKAMVRARGLQPLTDASVLLEQIVARDPDYPPAWALLAQAYAQIPTFHPTMYFGSSAEMRGFAVSYVSKADAAARRAIELDPKLADGYLSLGLTQRIRGNLTMAEELYLKALSLDPGSPDAMHVHARLLSDVGRLKEALATRQRLQAVEPFVPIFKVVTGEVLWLNGQNEAAIAMLNDVPNDFNGANYLAEIYASVGRYGDAADVLAKPQQPPDFAVTFREAVRLLRTAPTKTEAPQSLPRLANLTFVYLHVGAADRSLETYENATDAGYSHPYLFNEMWHSSYAPVRKSERFKAYLRRAGYVDYWRAKGWPEFCHPTTGPGRADASAVALRAKAEAQSAKAGDDFTCD